MSTATLQLPRGMIQESEYAFPYHHLPSVTADGTFSRQRSLCWGDEYLCYLNHAREMIERLEPSSILEVGCGDGRFIGMLQHIGKRHVGVDLSQRAIRFAAAFSPDIEFFATDAAELNESFDVVAAIEVLEHIPDDNVSSFLQTLAARTSPGGHVLISVPTTVKPLHKKHYRHYTLDLLQSQLRDSAAPLTIEHVDYVYRQSALLSGLRRIAHNRYWSFSCPLIETSAWRYVWRRLRYANARTGQHLVAMMSRNA